MKVNGMNKAKMNENAMNESAMNESAMNESAMNESAMNENVMNENVMKKTKMNESALNFPIVEPIKQQNLEANNIFAVDKTHPDFSFASSSEMEDKKEKLKLEEACMHLLQFTTQIPFLRFSDLNPVQKRSVYLHTYPTGFQKGDLVLKDRASDLFVKLFSEGESKHTILKQIYQQFPKDVYPVEDPRSVSLQKFLTSIEQEKFVRLIQQKIQQNRFKIREIQQAKEAKAKEAQTQEVQAKEVQTREVQTREVQAKEAKAKEAKAKEAQTKEAQTKEAQTQKGQAKVKENVCSERNPEEFGTYLERKFSLLANFSKMLKQDFGYQDLFELSRRYQSMRKTLRSQQREIWKDTQQKDHPDNHKRLLRWSHKDNLPSL